MSSLCWKVNSEVYLKYIVILNIPWHFLGFHFSISFATENGLKCFHFFVVVHFFYLGVYTVGICQLIFASFLNSFLDLFCLVYQFGFYFGRNLLSLLLLQNVMQNIYALYLCRNFE